MAPCARGIARVAAGNVYVNRNMIGAVVGVQPFGGRGLSGTGPKAGGPHYLHRFAHERTLTINTCGGRAATPRCWRWIVVRPSARSSVLGDQSSAQRLDIFKIGLGPSSSHTMGPMNAARGVRRTICASGGLLGRTAKIGVAALRLARADGPRSLHRPRDPARARGPRPDEARPGRRSSRRSQRIRSRSRLRSRRRHEIEFDEPLDLLFHRDQMLPRHPNGMRFTALDAAGSGPAREEYLLDRRRLHRPRRRFGREQAAGRPGRRAASVRSGAGTAGAGTRARARTCTSSCSRTRSASAQRREIARGAAAGSGR